MAHDGVLDAARSTLATLPDADQVLAELKAQLALAAATQAQLRVDLRLILTEYRAWRIAARCGRGFDMTGSNILLLHPIYMKQARRVWATYRLTQLLMRDMQAMASLRARGLNERQRVPVGFFRSANMPAPANEQTSGLNEDGISYESLERRYGPVMAQRLHDEIMAQLQYDHSRSAAKH